MGRYLIKYKVIKDYTNDNYKLIDNQTNFMIESDLISAKNQLESMYIDTTAYTYTINYVDTKEFTGSTTDIFSLNNLSGGTGVFASKVNGSVNFKSFTSTGNTITITNDSNNINLESSGGSGVGDSNKIFSWFMNVT